MASNVSRLVIRAPNWLGDAVMALPAMGVVRAAFGGTHIAVAAIPSIAPLFDEETSAGQDSVITLASPAAEIRALAAGRFDAIVLLPNSFRAAWSARRASIPERWGYSAGFRRWLLTRSGPQATGPCASIQSTISIWSPVRSEDWRFPRPIRIRASPFARRRWRGRTRCWPRTESPPMPAASASRPAPPTATPSVGRREWSWRPSSGSRASLALAA